MTMKRDQGTKGVKRRSVLKGMGLGAAATAGAALPWRRTWGQSQKTLRVWSTQVQPTQIAAWDKIIAIYEKENPTIKIEFSKATTGDMVPKLASALVANAQPEICVGGNAAMPASFHRQGVMEDLSGIAKEIGDFSPRMIAEYDDKGYLFSIAHANTVISAMWYRTDLLKNAGIAMPKTWDEMLAAGKALTKDGKFGLSLPYGKQLFLSQNVDMFVRQAGGDIIAPDGSVVFNSPAAVQTFEMLKEARAYCPTGANSAGYVETLAAFVTGAAAITMYTGRTLVNVATQNPSIDDHIAADYFPIPKGGQKYWRCGFDPYFVFKGSNVLKEEALKFTRFFFRKDIYTMWAHGAPGHIIPITKTVATSPEFLDHPILKKHAANMKKMIEIADIAHTDLKPTDKHPLQLMMGNVHNALILAEAAQRVIIDNMPPKEAAVWTQDRIVKLVKES